MSIRIPFLLVFLLLLAGCFGVPAQVPPLHAAGESPPVTVIANADARGELVPCACPGRESGGLSLRSALIKKLRAQPHPVLLVDAGDFCATPEDSAQRENTRVTLEAMALMEYSAVCLGEEDLLSGMEALLAVADRIPLVGGNLAGPGSLTRLVPPWRRLETPAGTFTITSWLDPVLLFERPEAWVDGEPVVTLDDPGEALRAIIEEARGRGDRVLVLAHAPVDQIADVLAGLPPVDVVVAGHRPEGESAPVVLGETVLLVPGERSRKIAAWTYTPGLEPDPRRRFRLHDLKRAQDGDPRIDALVGTAQPGTDR